MRLHHAASRVVARLWRLRELHGPTEVLLFLRVVAVAAAVPLFVRLSLPRQAALLGPRKVRGAAWRLGSRSHVREDPERVTRCVDVAQAVAGPLVRSGCLTRGITLYWFLGRSDDDIALCFGVGHPGGSSAYSGHCWLTQEGEPFLERVDPTETFVVVYSIPAMDTARLVDRNLSNWRRATAGRASSGPGCSAASVGDRRRTGSD